MKNDMDLNAGVIIEGKNSINEVGEAAFEKMLRVLNGEMTRNEATVLYFHRYPLSRTCHLIKGLLYHKMPSHRRFLSSRMRRHSFMYFIFYFL